MTTNASKTNRPQRSAVGMEPLEQRLCMSTSLSGIPSLAIGSADAVITGKINDHNTEDIFRIRLASASIVDLKLTKLTGNLTLQIVADRNQNNRLDSGEVISESKSAGTKDESISKTLDAGFYYVRMLQAGGGQSSGYTLTYGALSFATPDQRDTAGNDSTKAKAINPQRVSGMTIMEYVGGADTADWYVWKLDRRSYVNVRLNGLVENGDVTIFSDKNLNGKADASEALATTTGLSRSAKLIDGTIDAGTYFFKVTAAVATVPTPYSLRIVPAGPTSQTLSAKGVVQPVNAAPKPRLIDTLAV